MKVLKIRKGLPNFINKLKSGKNVCIGYLGGSITLAEGYRLQTLKWFQDKYPDSKITHINAGIGGTASSLGVCRLENDVLRYNPDMVFVDFATNDRVHSDKNWTVYAMEGIVRKIWKHNPETDICFLYSIHSIHRDALKKGKFYWTVESMEKIAKHYQIPSINLGLEVFQLEKEGKLVFQLERNSMKAIKAEENFVFCHDGVHPTKHGHELYTRIISRSISAMENIGRIGEHDMPSSLLENNWESAGILPLSKANVSSHWKQLSMKDVNLKCMNLGNFPSIYHTEDNGAEISFTFRGTGIGIFCIFGLNSGEMNVYIDDENYDIFPLFDKYGDVYRVHYKIITSDLEYNRHSVVLKFNAKSWDAGILKKGRDIPEPKQLEGFSCYIGGILIV